MTHQSKKKKQNQPTNSTKQTLSLSVNLNLNLNLCLFSMVIKKHVKFSLSFPLSLSLFLHIACVCVYYKPYVASPHTQQQRLQCLFQTTYYNSVFCSNNSLLSNDHRICLGHQKLQPPSIPTLQSVKG